MISISYFCSYNVEKKHSSKINPLSSRPLLLACLFRDTYPSFVLGLVRAGVAQHKTLLMRVTLRSIRIKTLTHSCWYSFWWWWYFWWDGGINSRHYFWWWIVRYFWWGGSIITITGWTRFTVSFEKSIENLNIRAAAITRNKAPLVEFTGIFWLS